MKQAKMRTSSYTSSHNQRIIKIIQIYVCADSTMFRRLVAHTKRMSVHRHTQTLPSIQRLHPCCSLNCLILLCLNRKNQNLFLSLFRFRKKLNLPLQVVRPSLLTPLRQRDDTRSSALVDILAPLKGWPW